jgi:hypothetical protein
MPPKPRPIDRYDLIETYNSGLGIQALARKFKVSHHRIAALLKESSIARRSMSEAVHAGLIRMSDDARARQDCGRRRTRRGTAAILTKRRLKKMITLYLDGAGVFRLAQ